MEPKFQLIQLISRKLERNNSFIIRHIDNKTKFEEKTLSTSFFQMDLGTSRVF